MIRTIELVDCRRNQPRDRAVRAVVTGLSLCLLGFGSGRVYAQTAPATTRIVPPVVHVERPSELSKSDPHNVSDLRAIEARVESIADRVRQCTVGIIVGDAQGSGVIVSDKGLVLTAAHVLMIPGRKVTIVLSDGKHLEGRALGTNSSSDCGAAQITEGGPFPACKISDMHGLRAGDWCLATGHPGGYQEGRSPVVRLGRIVERSIGMIQSDCPLLGGDSGGPLFDLNGNVIAIHSRIGARTSLNLHVPVSLFVRDWDRLTTAAVPHSDTTESPSMLGVDGQDDPKGARVTQVYPRSPADRAGLQTGDIITSFGGQKVNGFKGLQTMIAGRHPGDVVELRIRRDDSEQGMRATIAARARE